MPRLPVVRPGCHGPHRDTETALFLPPFSVTDWIADPTILGGRDSVPSYNFIENQLLFFDLEILFATIPVVLFGRGAY